MLNNLQQIDQHDYTNNYFIGKVVDNEDPEQLERVKVTIPNLFESSDTSLLPWVAPAHGRGLARGNGFGSFGAPTQGSFLIVILQNGDPQYPLYLGSPLLQGNQVDLAATNYPKRYGMKDSVGNSFYVDRESGEVKFRHKSGTSLIIADSGDVTLHVLGSITSDASSWTHTGDLSVDGKISATDDIESQQSVFCNDKGVRMGLSKHVHEGVDGGTDRTQEPAIVDEGDLP